MRLGKTLAVSGALLTVGLLALGGFGVAKVAADGMNHSDLAEKLSKRFNLDGDDVKQMLDEERTARQKQRQANRQESLQQAVSSGVITAEQLTLIENKLTEIQKIHESQRAELTSWADENGIAMKYLFRGRNAMRGVSRLDRAVSANEISPEQKALIETKQQQLRDQQEVNHEALEAWATENGIDLSFLHPLGDGHHMHNNRNN